jgi:hypothetical protein
MTFTADPRVDAYIGSLPGWQQDICHGAIVPDPEGIITAGHENKTARTVSFREGDPIRAEPLIAMFKAIIANNRAGGWRRLKAQSDI